MARTHVKFVGILIRMKRLWKEERAGTGEGTQDFV